MAGSAADSPREDQLRELLIGCGANKSKQLVVEGREGWSDLTTLDINPDHSPDIVWDLNQIPLPFDDESFDEIHAFETLEHVGRQGDYRFWFAQWSDFWRILKPNGFFVGSVPRHDSVWAWADPSHTRVIPLDSLVFLSQRQYAEQVGKTSMSDFRNIYSADFEIAWHDKHGESVRFVLQAIKPARSDLNQSEFNEIKDGKGR